MIVFCELGRILFVSQNRLESAEQRSESESFRSADLVESSRLERDATVCFVWVSEDSNKSRSRLEG